MDLELTQILHKYRALQEKNQQTKLFVVFSKHGYDSEALKRRLLCSSNWQSWVFIAFESRRSMLVLKLTPLKRL